VVVVVVIITAVTTVFPPLSCDLFDCCVFVCHCVLSGGYKKGGRLRSVSVFVTHEHHGGKIMPISPTLRHRTPRALCHNIETNTDSLVKGKILFAQEEGGGGGEKVMVESAPPRQSVVRLFFDVVCAKYFFFFFLIFSQAQKYWWETHMLDPLPLLSSSKQQAE